MPNLDELTHDMSFTIGGETFVVHDVAPEVLLTMEKVQGEEDPNADENVLAKIDEQILLFLNGDDDAVRRWNELRQNPTKPIPLWKILEFRTLLWETQSSRPTMPPSSSSPSGRGRTAPSSEGA